MHFMNTLLLLGASAATMINAATTSHYFEMSDLNSNTPSGLQTPAYDTINFPLTDSKTKTTTECTLYWNWSKAPSTTWTTCNDDTYAVQVDKYKSITDFTLTLRHQYNSMGEKCSNTEAKTCITTLATAAITKTGADFKSYCGSSGACGAVAGKVQKFTVSSSEAGTQ